MEYPTFDHKDADLLAARLKARRAKKGPLVGDFVLMPDARLMRFSHDWGDDIQISTGGSYYLCKSGLAQMSGGLEPSIGKTKIICADYFYAGSFWFFHHDMSGAHQGVYFTIDCQMYHYEGGVTLSKYVHQDGTRGQPTYM